MAEENKRIAIGRIGAAHGIRGEVRIKAYSEDPLAIADYGPLQNADGTASYEIVSARLQKSMVVARLKGVSDRTAAEKLNGVELYISRDQLGETDDEDEFYHTDLIGMEACEADGTSVGRIIAVPNFGASDLLEISPKGAKSFYLPFTLDFVPEIDFDAGKVTVVIPAGYLAEDDADEDDGTAES
ncbi:ribosome maturation factor RimM [Stappia sp. F7233]|uniref:Ribosome maturation factor RimM n=1 Tax=Stappia albiluteola TaxID=2758565 RepID=A0A839AIP4_9HYPH|nr:ribosome maturation factor RimM [Stappia albiluteola]MBA5778926.1 ribosome maturation factor RimM [Stappia albiluteola]